MADTRGARLGRLADLFRGEVPEWFARAACRGMTAVMYPEPPGNRDAIARAVAVCQPCPVLDQCRRWAVGPTDPVPHSVAAGMTWTTRNRLRRKEPRQ